MCLLPTIGNNPGEKDELVEDAEYDRDSDGDPEFVHGICVGQPDKRLPKNFKQGSNGQKDSYQFAWPETLLISAKHVSAVHVSAKHVSPVSNTMQR